MALGVENRLINYSRNPRSGFSLIEVVIAAGVMALGLTSAAICLQIGLSNFDNARTSTTVTHILQDEAERIRLMNWSSIQNLPDKAELQVPSSFQSAIGDKQIDVVRIVSDISGTTDLKQITLTGSWISVNGTEHSRIIHLRYAHGGLFDYYYGSAGN